jgi:hypothetical protein
MGAARTTSMHHLSGRIGNRLERSERSPEALTRPAASAAAQGRSPAASRTHVSGSVSTTAGGVPRVCRAPATHWMAAYGGTRTSTLLPGCARSSRARKCRVSSRRSPGVARSCRTLPSAAATSSTAPGRSRDGTAASITRRVVGSDGSLRGRSGGQGTGSLPQTREPEEKLGLPRNLLPICGVYTSVWQ